ncbi:hypothetical protein ACH3XW_24700 [Acanthocheilonema viteae]
MSACSDDQSEIDNNSKTGMDIPRTAIDHNEGQTQRQNTKYKLDPSFGAIPLEWLNPDRTNFRTRKLGDHHSNSQSDDNEHSKSSFSTTESNTV